MRGISAVRYEGFFHQIDLFQQRVESLQQQITASKHRASPLIETLTELQTAGEELQSAKEELQQKNDELTTAQQQSITERQRYQAFFDFAPDAYLITDHSGIIRQANLAAATQLAVPASRLSGKPLSVFIARTEQKSFRTQLTRFPPFPDKLSFTLAIQPRHGEAFPAEVVAGKLPEHNGAANQLCWQIWDATERQRMYTQLRRTSEELEQRVAERTAALSTSNTSLQSEIAARQQAEEQTRIHERWSVLGALAERVVHQIGNALNGLSTTVQLQQRYLNGETPQQSSVLMQTGQDLSHELTRLQLILEEWRTIARRPRFHFQPTRLPDLIRDILATQAAYYAAHNIQVETDIAVNLPAMSADPELLRQAVFQLCTNAVEAMPEGGTLSVQLSAQQTHACITISDTGSGITLRGDPFAPFTTTKTGHSGIGLTLTQQIVQAHRGTLTHAAAAERGSVFCLTLPIQP